MQAIYQRYQRASKVLKKHILDEFTRVCDYNRKYAIRLLNGPPPDHQPRGLRRRRGLTYGPRLIAIVQAVWEAAGYPWSARLKVILRDWLPWIRKHFQLTPELERQLLAISARQIDRRLCAKKAQLRKRIYGRTKPGTLLKHHIPIKTDNWNVTRPGFMEIDLVSHSGNSADGTFLHSLNMTDILTTWTESRAVMGKGQNEVRLALDEMRQGLPFPLLGIDSDNGSEFINAHLWRYCQQAPVVQFTRGRPYKKDDNAHIEQKNWTNVRKVMGYERYDSLPAGHAINALYRGPLRLMMNLYQPSIKLHRKVRVGSRLVRRYDQPQTPLDRLDACGMGDRAAVAALKALRASLDPFVLAATIERELDRIYKLANRHLRPKPGDDVRNKAQTLMDKTILTAAEQDILRKLSRYFRIKGVHFTQPHGHA